LKLKRLEEKPQHYVLIHQLKSNLSSFLRTLDMTLALQYKTPVTISLFKQLKWMQTTLKIAVNPAAMVVFYLDVKH